MNESNIEIKRQADLSLWRSRERRRASRKYMALGDLLAKLVIALVLAAVVVGFLVALKYMPIDWNAGGSH